MPSDSSIRCFYQHNALHTVAQGDAYHTLLRRESTPLAEQHSAASAALLPTDGHGSVLLGLWDGQAGSAHAYAPYGHNPTARSASGLAAFNGERLEPASQLYLLGNYRLYSTTLRRFLSADSLSPFEAGGLNAYAYCSGDPINYTDPSGHMLGTKIFKPKTADYYKAKRERLIQEGNLKMQRRNQLADRVNAANQIDKNRHQLYEASGKPSQRNWISDHLDEISSLDKEFDKIKSKVREADTKYQKLASMNSRTPSASRHSITSNYEPSAPRASIISNYEPSAPRGSTPSNYEASAPRGSVVSNYEPSAPRASIITLPGDLVDKGSDVRRS